MIDILLAYLLMGVVVAQLVFIWLNTNAFVEYISILHLGRFFKVSEFKEVTVDDPASLYSSYIAANYNNFFTRLISCPKCLGMQLSILLNIIVFIFLPISWLFFIPSLLITAYLSSCLYFVLVILQKHS